MPCTDRLRSTGLAFRALALALLAVVALQAAPARPLALDLDRGPAFSAGSAEVALVAQREPTAEIRPLQLPALPQPVVRPRQARFAAALPALPRPGERQTGPPAADPRPPQASPRAPPHPS